MGLSDTQYDLLKHLHKVKEMNPSNHWTTIEDWNKNTVKSLERLKFIEVDNVYTSAVITPQGSTAYVAEKIDRNGIKDLRQKAPVVKEALSEVPNADAVGNGVSTNALPLPEELTDVKTRIQPFVEDAGLDNTDSPFPKIPALTEPDTIRAYAVAMDKVQTDECTDDCGECVHREVLDLIAEQYPNVGKLRDVYLAKKKLMSELGLDKK